MQGQVQLRSSRVSLELDWSQQFWLVFPLNVSICVISKRLNQITINFCYNCLSDLRLSTRSHNTRMIQSNLIHIIPGITYVYWLILHICMIFWCYSSTQNNLESTTLFVLYTKFFCIFKKKLVEMLYIISLAQVNRERSFCSHVFKIMDLTQDWMKEASS